MKTAELVQSAKLNILNAALLNSTDVNADDLIELIDLSTSRFSGIGAEQYTLDPGTEKERQKFEDMKLRELADWLREEAVDLVNYLIMLQEHPDMEWQANWKVAAVEKAMKGALILFGEVQNIREEFNEG
jgi:hypothetical protein